MLVTKGGTEIALQNILHLDDELLAIKGRLAGSQDMGRLYFVALDNIDYFGFNRMVKDEEYAAMFGNMELPPMPVAVTPAAYAVAPAPPPEQPPAQEEDLIPSEPPAADPPRTPSPTASLRPVLPIKSAVLERFRSRGAGPASGNGAKPSGE
jgi:hypothetical protein